ncbi:MAG: 2-haloacrylate reductase [Planctomycetota bacterium]|nr:2-haloacrylate reductase [Planctomycetota bacterium]
MRAAYIESTGPPDVIQVGELMNPEPGPGEVLVRVGYAALNPIDLYLRSGLVPMPMAYPYVVGCDLAGTVQKVGAGVTRFREGDRVWGSNQGLLGRQGTCAELASVHEEWLYPTPKNVTDRDAAAMALVGIAAHVGLFQSGNLRASESIYVPGGSGGVGSMVVQMAKATGARVATSAGSDERVKLCLDLGAEVALNYKTDDIPSKIREFAPEGVDIWFETQREPVLEISIPLLRVRGRMILMAGRAAKPPLPLGAFYPRCCSIHGFAMFNCTPLEQRRCAEDINRWAQEGKLHPIIGKEFPLEQTAEAEQFLEDNTLHGAGTLTGKVVIRVS